MPPDSVQPLMRLPARPKVPPATPPAWDCYPQLHSCDLQYEFRAPPQQVREALTVALVDRPLQGDTTLYRLEPEGPADRDTFRFMRVSKYGFKDMGSYTLVDGSGGGSGTDTTLAHVKSFSADPHLWSIFPCCPVPVAAFFCCCGLFPTKDWGQNEDTVEEINKLTALEYSRK